MDEMYIMLETCEFPTFRYVKILRPAERDVTLLLASPLVRLSEDAHREKRGSDCGVFVQAFVHHGGVGYPVPGVPCETQVLGIDCCAYEYGG